MSRFVSGLPSPRRAAKTRVTPLLSSDTGEEQAIRQNHVAKYHAKIPPIPYRPSYVLHMKLLTILFVVVPPLLFGSELGLTTVTQPLYLHGSESDSRISLEPVPYVTSESDPEWRFSAICVPFVPPSRGSWRAHDINLASLYRIKVEGTYGEDGKDVVVNVDASKATQPEGYPFTVEQVVDAVVTCVKIMYPQRPADEGALKISIRGAPKGTK